MFILRYFIYSNFFLTINHQLIMNKSGYLSIVLILLFGLNSVYAQQTSGIVKYKGVINEDFRNKFLEETASAGLIIFSTISFIFV